MLYSRMRFMWSWPAGILLASLAAIAYAKPTSVVATDNNVFQNYTAHITRQVAIDRVAFVRASTCLSWFYKGKKKSPPPVVEGISWRPALVSDIEKECLKLYPGGMEAAREDFARTQALLSVSITVYELALVADHNDDQSYSSAELSDLFHSLSLAYDAGDSPQSLISTLTARFDHWYRTRNLDEVMQGMNALYDRGYRVTLLDRTELDRIMK